MKTKTQEQLEKEIKKIQKKIKEDNFSDLDTLNLFEAETKLSQHKTDINNFEKLVDDLRDILDEAMSKDMETEEKKMFYEFSIDDEEIKVIQREIKEALKEL